MELSTELVHRVLLLIGLLGKIRIPIVFICTEYELFYQLHCI
jgi:hypothetical protein